MIQGRGRRCGASPGRGWEDREDQAFTMSWLEKGILGFSGRAAGRKGGGSGCTGATPEVRSEEGRPRQECRLSSQDCESGQIILLSEHIAPRERSQTQTTYYMTPFRGDVRNWKAHRDRERGGGGGSAQQGVSAYWIQAPSGATKMSWKQTIAVVAQHSERTKHHE